MLLLVLFFVLIFFGCGGTILFFLGGKGWPYFKTHSRLRFAFQEALSRDIAHCLVCGLTHGAVGAILSQ